MVDQPEFQRALDFAMLEFSAKVCSTTLTEDERVIGGAGLKLRGAHEFMDILKHLSEKPTPVKVLPKIDQLNPIQ